MYLILAFDCIRYILGSFIESTIEKISGQLVFVQYEETECNIRCVLSHICLQECSMTVLHGAIFSVL